MNAVININSNAVVQDLEFMSECKIAKQCAWDMKKINMFPISKAYISGLKKNEFMVFKDLEKRALSLQKNDIEITNEVITAENSIIYEVRPEVFLEGPGALVATKSAINLGYNLEQAIFIEELYKYVLLENINENILAKSAAYVVDLYNKFTVNSEEIFQLTGFLYALRSSSDFVLTLTENEKFDVIKKLLSLRESKKLTDTTPIVNDANTLFDQTLSIKTDSVATKKKMTIEYSFRKEDNVLKYNYRMMIHAPNSPIYIERSCNSSTQPLHSANRDIID